MPAIPEGWAILITTFIGLLAVYIQYKLRIRNTSILLANALTAEITTTYERQALEMRQNRIQIENKAKEGKEKFTSWSGREIYAIYDNTSEVLLLLPENTLKEVVHFYQYDSWLANKIVNMSSETFYELPGTTKTEYVREIYDAIDNEYTRARDKAIEELQKINRKPRLPW